MATSYGGGHRLKPLGIDNHHAPISGMPMLKEEEEKMATQAILAMRGVKQKKHKVMHEEGNLELQIRPMAYKGTSVAWMRSLNISKQGDWTEEPAIPGGPALTKEILKQVACPKCGHMKDINDFKVKGKAGYRMMKRKRCHSTSSASLWRCSCKYLWHNCEMHVLRKVVAPQFARGFIY